MACMLSAWSRFALAVIAAWLLPACFAASACDGIEAMVGNESRCLKPGAGKTEWFKDSDSSPEMVVVPAGRFTMGSPSTERGHEEEREKQVPVTIGKPFAVGRFAVTRGEFAAFVAATGHKTDGGCFVPKQQANRNWRSPGFQQNDRHPVVCVNWNDAKAYVDWLSSTTGKPYRLLSDTEREYVTRAGTTTSYWPGNSITTRQANFKAKATVPVESFAANPWGLYNVHGNVLEWTEDCWRDNNAGNPGDGSARTSGPRLDCDQRVLRGGAWNDTPDFVRSAVRDRIPIEGRSNLIGFRVARTL
jgi:formylglycine-generating enzyme required for sulfatase activity